MAKRLTQPRRCAAESTPASPIPCGGIARHNRCMSRSANWLRHISLTSVLTICAGLTAADRLGNKAAKTDGDSGALERVSWRDDVPQSHEVTARVLVEAADGGLLLVGQDGRLWSVEKP